MSTEQLDTITDPTDQQQALLNAGWEFDGFGWINPASKEPSVELHVDTILHKNGTKNEVKQWTRSPIPWKFTEEQALAILNRT